MTRLALVTGATGGIGQVIVERLLTEGYTVIACGRNLATLQRLVETNVRGTVHPLAFALDDPGLWEQTVRSVLLAYVEPPTLLVCAHGAAPCIMPTLILPSADVERVWRTDVLGTLRMCQTVGTAMLPQRDGAIVIVSSLHARLTYPQRTAYSMAKSALSGLVRSLAVEWGPHHVRTNAVLPWQVQGARSDGVMARYKESTGEDLEELYKQRSPMRRLLAPEDVADAVLFCARNPTLNGHELVLDGGVSASMWYEGFCHQAEG